MKRFGACILLVFASTGSQAFAQSRDGNQEQFAFYCRPPLKFAAGACLPVCPAGFEDRGRVCVFRSQGGGSGA